MDFGLGTLDLGLRTLIRQQHGPITTHHFASLNDARIAHAIFARHGGVSPAPWHSLNLSTATGDSLDHIAENYRRVYGALGYTPADAVTSRQVHGATVAVVDGAQRGQRLGDCDALITNTPDVVLLQRHADCPPIFLYDPQRRAIGVAHAGWRGTLANIAGETVRAMSEAFGSQPSDVIAAIGPAIGACCYHVGVEVQQAFTKHYALGQTWLHANGDGNVYLDLWEANRAQLQAAGVHAIEVAGICTACHISEFYSARAERRMNGCFGAAIALRSNV